MQRSTWTALHRDVSMYQNKATQGAPVKVKAARRLWAGGAPIDERQAAGAARGGGPLGHVELLSGRLALQLLGLRAVPQASARHGPSQGHAGHPALAVSTLSLHRHIARYELPAAACWYGVSCYAAMLHMRKGGGVFCKQARGVHHARVCDLQLRWG